ncbi:MAG: alanine racemase [Lysobacterales bacterium CG02_land_8_20_14_3_00_62_12]|nr:MAG: alanine racemase [Xanthomonadales bacterium CG02_land_8_20_14_3_00_62_12]
MSRLALATVHLGALRANLQRIRVLAAGSKVMAVVKADGYGHGLERVARALAVADAYGVASIADGQRLRAAGHRQRIVVLSGIDAAGDLPEVRRLRLDVVVHHRAQIDLIAADADPRPLRVWLKIDTGMHRLGLPVAQVAAAVARLRALPNVDPALIWMSHFASSDAADPGPTETQLALFNALPSAPNYERTIANSAAIVAQSASRLDWVRAGGLLYGMAVVDGRTGSDFGFHPAMSLSSKLISIQRVSRGQAVGYGGTWCCPEDMDVGVVAIGYGDGYPRSVPSGTPVLIAGRPAPIIGRVSMDLLTVDLRQHAAAVIGAPVLLWGPALPVEKIAAAAGSISYELACGVTRRVMVAEDDQPVAADPEFAKPKFAKPVAAN